MIYLDHCATAPPPDEVIEAVADSMRIGWANPSSVHRAGQEARRRLELARVEICGLIGCREAELVLTSGGTEAADLAVRGALAARSDRPVLVTSRLEHAAVGELATALEDRGTEVVWLPNDDDGLIDLAALEQLLAHRGDEISLVSIMWVNNETGVIQAMDRIAGLCSSHGVLLHTDATQHVGKLPTDLGSVPINLLSFAAHKLGGPMGVGALFVRAGTHLIPQLVGGPHERERRAGTENLPGIVGFGVACRLARAWLETEEPSRQERLRDAFEQRVLARISGTSVHGGGVTRSWDVSNIAFDRLEAEPLLLGFSERGLYASAGAACSSGSVEPSPVLLAMHVPPERAVGSIRFSVGRDTTAELIDQAIEIVSVVVERLRIDQ